MSQDFAHQPVPDDAATRPARSLAIMISSTAMGVPVMILGAVIGADYGGTSSWVVIVLGCAITAGLAGALSYAGATSRRSTALLARQAFGSRGATFLNVAIGWALLGWFAVEMGFIGEMVAAGARNVFGLTVGRSVGIVVASGLICTICLSGIALLSRVPIFFLPILSILLLTVLLLAAKAPPPAGPALPISQRSVGTGISAIVGAYIAGCLIMPDYSRFIRSATSAVIATTFAVGPVYGLVLGTYALAGSATRQAEPSAIFLSLGLSSVIGLLLPLGLMQNGIMCLYSSALATSALSKSLSFRWVTFCLALIGAGLALAGVDQAFVSFLVLLGLIFPPAVALLIYVGIIEVADSATKISGWRPFAFAAWITGIVTGAMSEWIGVGLTGLSAFDGFLGAAFMTGIMHVCGRKGAASSEGGEIMPCSER